MLVNSMLMMVMTMMILIGVTLQQGWNELTLSLTLTLTITMPTDSFRAYFKQARDELGLRLMEHLFDADGSKNKWWQVANCPKPKSSMLLPLSRFFLIPEIILVTLF